MKITYMGTSASEGWPALFCNCSACRLARKLGGKNIRTRCQALIDETLLLDFPPDTNYHALQYGLNLSQIRTLLVTHSHHDHFFAPDLCMRMPAYAADAEGILDVFGDEEVEKNYENAREIFPGIDNYVQFHETEPFTSFHTQDGYDVVSIAADHNPPERSLNYIIQKEGKTLLWAHDTGIFPERSFEVLGHYRFDLVSLDCTALSRDWYSGHMGFDAVDSAVSRMKKMGCIDSDTRIVISHFAHYGSFTHDKICEIEAPKGIDTAYDGCSFTL